MTRCVVCGRYPQGMALVSLHNEVTCAAHEPVSWCLACNRSCPDTASPGWSDLGNGLSRCPTCAANAVNTQQDVRSALPAIRATARSLGFSLRTAVRVELTTPAQLMAGYPEGSNRTVFGVTEMVVTGARKADVTVIRILAGLPHDSFGSTVAHELGHAWLGQTGARPREKSVEEGLCELISYAWLKKVNSPFATALRDHIAHNPDPLYGDGFRKVHTAVRTHGITAVLTTLAQTGELPDDHARTRKQ